MTDAFISYSRRDSEFVGRLANGLEQRGKSAWVDTEGIADAEVFPRAIRQAIESADSFVFVITPASATSAYCASEVDHARELGKRIVPVLRERVADDDLPPEIRDRNWIPFDVDTGFDAGLQRLDSALDTDIEHVRGHTRWLVRAVTWDENGREGSRLLRGGELREAESWLTAAPPGMEPQPTVLQREFILAGRRAAQRRQRLLIGATGAVAVVSLALLVFAVLSRQQAVHQRTTARANALAAESEAQLPNDSQIGLGLAVKAVKTSATTNGLFALREALDSSSLLTDLPFGSGFDCNPALAYSPDGRLIAEASCKGDVRIVDAATRTVVRTIAVTGSSGVAFAPEGKQLAISLPGNIVQLRDVATGALGQTLRPTVPNRPATPGTEPTSLVAFSRDGTEVAGSDGSNLTVWDLRSSSSRLISTDPQESLAFTPSGRALVVGELNSKTVIVDSASGAILHTISAPGQNVSAVSPDGSELAIGHQSNSGNDWDGVVDLYDENTGAYLRTVATIPAVAVAAIAWSPTGDRLALGNADGTGGVWSVRTDQRLVAFLGQSREISSLAFRPDGDAVATFSQDGIARVWQSHGGESLYVETPAVPQQAEITASLGSTALVVADVDAGGAEVTTWTLPAGRQTTPWRLPAAPGSAISLSSDGCFLALAPSDGEARTDLYDVRTHALVRELPALRPTTMVWSPDDTELAVFAPEYNETLVFDLAHNGRLVGYLTNPQQCGGYTGLAFSADGKRLAGEAQCGTIGIWDAQTGRVIRTIASGDELSSVALNTHGTQVAVGSWDSRALVWDVASGHQIQTLLGHTRGVDSIAFSPNGQWLLTGSQDETVRLWDSASSAELHEIPEPQVGSTPVFGPTGSTLAVVAPNGSVRVWQSCQSCGDAKGLLSLAAPRMTTQLSALEKASLDGS